MRSARRRPPSRARARLRPRRSVAPRPHRRRRPLLRRPRPRHHPPPRFPRSPQPLPRPRRPRSARRLRRRPRRIPDGRLSAVISVVVPVYNEERSVALLYDELRSALEPLQTPWETIFVDDGSTDGTFGALTRLHNAEENVRVVRLRRNFGKAAALVAGFDQARGETVVTIDGDLQDDPAEIPRLLAKLDEGFDLVSGWKAHRRDPLSRRVLSRIFNRVTSLFSGVRMHDLNCGLKAYRADVVHGLRLYGELHRFIPVLAHYRGFRIAELPVNHRPRDRASAAADAGRSPPGDRDAVLFARPDQRDDHEPSRGTRAGARARGAARRRNPVLRRRLGGAA